MLLVIGYGNTLRGDDGVGPAVAEAIARTGLPGVRSLAVALLMPELAAEVAQATRVVFVDAALLGQTDDVSVVPVHLGERLASLGHTSDPGCLLALAEVLYDRSPPAWLIRIPVEQFELGVGLSPGGQRGMAEAIQKVLAFVDFKPMKETPRPTSNELSIRFLERTPREDCA